MLDRKARGETYRKLETIERSSDGSERVGEIRFLLVTRTGYASLDRRINVGVKDGVI